jgi:hypothetical protein
MLSDINIITVIIIGLFTLPLLVGILRPLTSERIYYSFASLINNVILLTAVLLSVYCTRLILADEDGEILTTLFHILPTFQSAAHRDIWLSALFITLLSLLIYGLLYLLTIPIRRFAIVSLSNRLSASVRTMNGFFKRIIGGLWQLPKSVWLVVIFSLLLNLTTGFFNSPYLTQTANNSAPYQVVQEGVIQPLMNSSAVKGIQVILNDSFKFNVVTDESGSIQLIKYFNGVPLNEAIESNDEIDAKAKEIVGDETDDRQKAYLIYQWVCSHLTYDNAKAAALVEDSSKISSGALVAYRTGTGVCFDYACLYIAMCRAVDVRVRFITGLGFTGSAWGDHAWNQIYDPKYDGWVNVDTTFGSSGINYFGRTGFELDHKNAVVQGEWP